MSSPNSPAWRHTRTFVAKPERTGIETSLRQRRGDALPSPRPPFSYSLSTNSSPRSEHHALHHSSSSASLRPPHSPSPSMASLTPSQAPSFAPSFTPSFTPSFSPSIGSGRGFFRRTHRPSSSISPPASISVSHSNHNHTQNQWQPAMPSAIVNVGGEAKDSRPGVGGRSVSDSIMPTLSQPKPKLQRKKSNASILYQGLGRGLSRVGSVMRRGNNSGAITPSTDPLTSSVSSTASSSVGSGSAANPSRSIARRPPPPKRCGSTTLQDLCEEAEAAEKDREASASSAPRAGPPRDRPTALSVYVPPPPTERENGVSRPFNVLHELHVTADLDGLPSEWLDSLKAQGLTEHDLLLITSAQRRQRAVVRHPIVRTRTPIDTSRPPSPTTHKESTTPASSPSPAKTESTVIASPTRKIAPSSKELGSPRARTTTTLHLSPNPSTPNTSPCPTPSAQSSNPQLTLPKPTRGRLRSPTVTSPPSANRRSLSAPQERGVTVKRSASLLGKLLDDIDSKSSRPSRRLPPGETLRPPDYEKEIEVIDASKPQLADHLQLQKRLSDELRGFHDILIPGEDGWAASILAAWEGDNALAREAKVVTGGLSLARQLSPEGGASRAEILPTPEPGTMSSSAAPSRSPTPDSSPFTRLAKPRSASSLCIPSVDVDDVDDESSSYFVRRRSKSFDHIVDRSTLYSPPPPPPHPQRNSSTAGDTPPTAFRSPHGGRLRASRDSFGVAHTISTRSSFIAVSIASRRSQERRDDDDDERDEQEHAHLSHTSSHSGDSGTPGPSPSRTSSELDLGTPPASDLSSAVHAKEKDNSLIHERLSIASAIEQARCRPFSLPPSDPEVERVCERHLSLPDSYMRETPEATSSVDTSLPSLSPLSTMVHQHSPTDVEFYDTYLGVGWCAACNATSGGIGNLSQASTSALGLSLNAQVEHTCAILGRQASVRSTSSYLTDRASVMSVGGTSQLSRMSSIASSTHSYNLHEVTVHRAYTRVLRRVPERSETYSSGAQSELGGSNEDDGDMSAVSVWESARHSARSSERLVSAQHSAPSSKQWESARQSVQSARSESSAISSLGQAAWHVAVHQGMREGCI